MITKFLLTPDDLQREFASLLNQAKSIKVAVAWATLGVQINMLKNAHLPTEVVVGKAFNLTNPDAIAALRGLGKFYVDERKDSQGLFHPKFYLFQLSNKYVVIIGSPNLTAGGFTANSEASLRLSLDRTSAEPLLKHYLELREGATPVTSAWLKQYRRQYKPPRSGIGKRLLKAESQSGKRQKSNTSSVGELLTYRWTDYYQLLLNNSLDSKGRDTLFDQKESYLKTLEVVGPIIRKRFNRIQGDDFRYLIGGRETQPNTGYFGSLTGAGHGIKALMKEPRLRRDITRLLPQVQRAKGEVSVLRAARNFFLHVVRVKGVKHATATRFLALSRPDIFFSLNKESVNKLVRVFGIAGSRLKEWDGYQEALQKLWQSKWYRSARPNNFREAKVWDARAALIDVYASEYEWK